ncbi:hypothetical protein CMV_009282 [Castanea mollissima]|uniref:EXPERA domain-containing protein n=1 Tax=Castanea mollissima TaxID=60419 RepID=A0A8J4VR37_9ROSI|nr:hypothetical protein CMV_009282 [Castanea mollissima]
MGALLKLIDAVLFVFFMVIALAAPLIDAQTCLPLSLFPDLLLDLKNWYAREYGDYLIAEKPDFFVGIVWLELFFQWPLALLNLYAILARKPWFNTTCLIYGASCLTSMVTILSELIGSHKASDKLLMMYFPFLGFGVLAILRGLMPHSGRTTSTIGKRPLLARDMAGEWVETKVAVVVVPEARSLGFDYLAADWVGNEWVWMWVWLDGLVGVARRISGCSLLKDECGCG